MKQQRIFGWILPPLLILAAAYQDKVCLGQQFEVHGTIELDLYARGKPYAHQTRPFVASVSNRLFRIEAQFDQTTNKMIYSFDGQSLYTVFIAPAEPAQVGTLPQVTNNLNDCDSTSQIYPRLMPINEDGSYINLIWLMYASQNYFLSLTNELVAPIWPTGPSSGPEQDWKHPLHVIVHTNHDILGLPREIEYINDGETGGPRLSFTNATFRVLATASTNGMSIPTEFEYIRYSETGSKALVTTAHGYATNISIALSTDSFLPVFSGISYVYDYRLTSRVKTATGGDKQFPYITYRVTNGQWFPNDDTRAFSTLQAATQKHLEAVINAQPPMSNSTPVRSAYLLLAAFAFMNVTVVIILIRRAYRRSRNSIE